MKQKKIFWKMIIVCLVVAAGVILWQKHSSSSPEAVTQKKLNEIFKDNDHMSEQEQENLAALFMTEIQETQLACALEEPTLHQETFFANIKTGLQKINYEISEVSRLDEEAEVTVSIQYFRLQEIAQNAQKALQEELKKDGSLSTEEMIEKLYELIADEFQKGPSDDSKVKLTVHLHKEKNKWKTEDSFENEIMTAILQQ